MPQLQQMFAVTTQFAGQLGRGNSLTDPADNQHQLRRTTMSPRQRGPGPGIEHPAAPPAPIVQHRLPMATMHPQLLSFSTVGARQTLGVKYLHELGITGEIVQAIRQREIHGLGLP